MITTTATALEWLLSCAVQLQKGDTLSADDWALVAEDLQKVNDYVQRKADTVAQETEARERLERAAQKRISVPRRGGLKPGQFRKS